MYNSKYILRILLAILFLVILVSCDDSGSEPEDDSNWELVWQDEFNGSSGSLPDPTKWTFDVGTDWGNAQLEYDTDRAENASLDGDGNLAIVAREEIFGGRAYTSARIKTQGLFERTHGKFEARMKMPWGPGLWPAFWLLGSNIDNVGWPQCGEIDIMEYRGQEPNIVHATVHGPGYSGGGGVTNKFVTDNDRFDVNFHVFSVEWGSDYMRFYMDDNMYHEIKPGDLNGDWVFNSPFFIILNVAVGGNYVGSPTSQTTFPQTMLVDYVRVYKAK